MAMRDRMVINAYVTWGSWKRRCLSWIKATSSGGSSSGLLPLSGGKEDVSGRLRRLSRGSRERAGHTAGRAKLSKILQV
jgi:hypothetical protein